MTPGGTGPSWTFDQIDAAMEEIRRYLAKHPNATDTISGVHALWLAGSGAAVSVEVVQVALELLTRSGVLDARRVPGGEVIYCGSRSGK